MFWKPEKLFISMKIKSGDHMYQWKFTKAALQLALHLTIIELAGEPYCRLTD